MKIGAHKTVIRFIFHFHSGCVYNSTMPTCTPHARNQHQQRRFGDEIHEFDFLSHFKHWRRIRWFSSISITRESSMRAICFANTIVNELCTLYRIYLTASKGRACFSFLFFNQILMTLSTLLSRSWVDRELHIQAPAPIVIEFTKFKSN